MTDGVEEWSCGDCSRRMLLRRPPAFEQFVIDSGDEWAAHVGGTGGLHVVATQACPPAVGLSEHERGWLAEQGIAWEPDDTP